MSVQTLITASVAGLAAFHFLRGAYRDLRGGKGSGSTCGKCSGGCPAARHR